MKKQIVIFFSNIIIAVFAAGIAVNVSPLAQQQVIAFSDALLSISRPYENLKKASSEVSLIISGNQGNTNTTAQEEPDGEASSSVMNSINAQNSSHNASLTQTPDDVVALMKAEAEAIGSQRKKGETSEENYVGGGTVISFGNVEIQSKIPESFYKPDIEALLKQGPDIKISDASKPTVLIYHSHSTECYTLLDVGYYTESTDLKTKDTARNMVRVGDEICKIFEEHGIGVVHDREIHDLSYNAAYDSSRKSVEDYLEKYPSIEITIDVHRDSITYKNGTKVKPTAVINDKKAARMMIISGCLHGRVKNFENWESNLRFSTAVTDKINGMYPGLMRPILFSERRYNMDLTKNSFLLEIGTEGNTLDEACYSGRLFATALSELILEEYTN